MACNRPITAYYGNHVNPETGKRSLVFRAREAYSGSDPTIPRQLEIPCGKCLGCKADGALMWSIRSYHESQLHRQNSFITLTYDNEHLPKDGKLDKTHLQKFFKRLRRDGTRVRYIACGEYGGQTRRPHYHAIVFGKDFLEGAIDIKDSLYTNPALVETWQMGMVSIAPVTMASICYVCGYVNKKIDDPDTFNLMSRRPGIGHDWLDRFSDDIKRTGVVSIEGRSYQVPKRYLIWNEKEFEELKKERAAFALANARKKTGEQRFYAGNAREEKLRAKRESKRHLEKL